LLIFAASEGRGALDSAGIKIGNAADEILGRPAFPYTWMKTDVELALLSAADLGVESESSLSDLYKRAKQVGLELCPAEVAPQLRLDYRNQPLGEALNIAMEPVATHSGEPTSPARPAKFDLPSSSGHRSAGRRFSALSWQKHFLLHLCRQVLVFRPGRMHRPRCLLWSRRQLRCGC
jgi:hypothetical protein